ncbi:MAG: AAA family ATPase [Pseudomonadota bacterium]
MERLVGKYIFDPEISAGKMLFLTGPRQVGKTTFAKNWLSSERIEDTYFDWDESLFTRSSTDLEGVKHFRTIASKFLHQNS